MDKYYYFGEFGYLNLEILGGLEQYFKKFPDKKIGIATFESYGVLLKYLFPKNVKIINPKKEFLKERANYNSSKVDLSYSKRKDYTFIHYLIKDNFKTNNKVTADDLVCSNFSKEIVYKREKEPAYISIFPRKREICFEKNLSQEVWEEIIKKIKLSSDKKIIMHGVGKEKLSIKGDFIYPKNVLEQIYYLNNSICCICPDSGFAHFSLNCGCDTLVVGKSYWIFSRFNPFNKKLFICDENYALNSDVIKRFLLGKRLKFKEKIKMGYYHLLTRIRRFIWYPLKNKLKKYNSLFKKVNHLYMVVIYGKRGLSKKVIREITK